jgi:four helix bundle protein
LKMINIRPHKKLNLWIEAMDLVTFVYDLTSNFPKEEEFGLKSQIRRASVSIPSNIAEGLTRRTIGDKLHFLNIADGSLSELDTQFEISLRLKFIDTVNFELVENKMVIVQKLLSGLIRSLKK